MKPFRFSLERLLKWRSAETRLARIAYGQATAAAAAAAAELAALRAARRRLEASLASLRDGLPRAAGALRVVLGAIDRLEDDVGRAQVSLGEAEAEVERQREKFVERRRDERVLESLRRKRQHEHATASLAEEAKFLDEVARDRFLRSGGAYLGRE